MKTLPKYEEIVLSPRPIALPAKSRTSPKICLVRVGGRLDGMALLLSLSHTRDDVAQVLDLDETLVHCSVDDVESPHLQFPVRGVRLGCRCDVKYAANLRLCPHVGEL